MSNEYVVQREGANLPQTATEDLFTVAGGKVLVLGIVGEVTAHIQNQAVTITVAIDAHTLYANADLANAAAGLLLGALYSGGGTSSYDLSVVKPFPLGELPLVLQSGASITLNCSASNTGQVGWTLWYKPLEPGAKITAT